jgi:hypothetical protein
MNRYPLPASEELASQVLHTYDLVVFWVASKATLQAIGTNPVLAGTPHLLVIANPDIGHLPATLLANTLGIVAPNHQIGAELDGKILGDITVVNPTMPNQPATQTDYERALNAAAPLAQARKPYLQLARDLGSRFTDSGSEEIDRVADLAFELFDLA